MATVLSSRKASGVQELLHVRIVSATQPVWEGDAVSISSVNSDGPFDILPMHANFISLVKKSPFVVSTASGERQEWHFEQAVVYVQGNTVRIYADFLKNIVKTR